MWYFILVIFSLASSSLYAQDRIYRCRGQYVTNIEYEKYPDVYKKECKLIASQPNVTPKGDTTLKSKPKSKSPSSDDVKFSMDMLEGSHFNPRYSGYSVEEVVNAIDKLIGLKKAEFESTIEFNARKARGLSEKFLNNATFDDIFAFSVPVSGSREISYKYDADTYVTELYVLPKSSSGYNLSALGGSQSKYEEEQITLGELNPDLFPLGSKEKQIDVYKGSNAFGAVVSVDRSISTKFGIAAKRISFLHFERKVIYSNPAVSAQFKVDNLKAASELPALKALVVMKLIPPFILHNTKHFSPTIKSPHDVMVEDRYLVGDVLGIVFYSGITGEMFARIPEKFGRID